MADQSRSEIISANPIGEGLYAFHYNFNSTCARLGIPYDLQALERMSSTGKHTLALSWYSI